MQALKMFRLFTLLVALLAGVGACNGGGGAVPCDQSDPDCDTPTPPPPSCDHYNFYLNPIAGYTEHLTVAAPENANTNQNCVSFTYTGNMSATPFDIPFTPPPNGQVLFYYEIAPAVDDQIAGYPGVNIQAPLAEIVSGRSFYVAANDAGPYGHWRLAQGPLHVDGETLEAPVTGSCVWSIGPGDPFEFVVYSEN